MVMKVFQASTYHFFLVNGLYQTFFTYDCPIGGYISGYLCKTQYVEFLTAVYTGNNFDIEVRQVKIPTHCAVSIG